MLPDDMAQIIIKTLFLCICVTGSIQEQSVLGDVSRKDSLSLKVEFINLNISRSRKLEIKTEGIGLMDKLDPVKSNVVRFSGTVKCFFKFMFFTGRFSYRRNLTGLSLPICILHTCHISDCEIQSQNSASVKASSNNIFQFHRIFDQI